MSHSGSLHLHLYLWYVWLFAKLKEGYYKKQKPYEKAQTKDCNTIGA